MENYFLSPQKQTKEQMMNNISKYLETRVAPLLNPLQTQLLLKRPEDIAKFSLEWLKQDKLKTQQKVQNKHVQDVEIQSNENIDEVIKQKRRKRNQFSKTRSGILGDKTNAQLFQVQHKILEEPQNDWPQQTRVTLIIYLRKSIFFQHLDSNELIGLIKRMNYRQFASDETIIEEGDAGNQLFIVQSGKLKCQQGANNRFIKYLQPGELFGELSLLYNQKRACSVVGFSKGKIFSLHRRFFHAVIHQGLFDRIKECEQISTKVELFHNLSLYERSKLFQTMEILKVSPEKFVIRQGQVGNCIFLVAEGHLVAYKRQGSQVRLVKTYRKGDYFGQLALWQDNVRQASVKAVTQSKLFFINKQAFSRILGSIENILKRNQQLYMRISPSFNRQYKYC